MTARATQWLGILAVAVCALWEGALSRFVESGTSYYVRPVMAPNKTYLPETFFIQFNAMRPNDTKCEVRQTIKPAPLYDLMNFSNQTSSQFFFAPLMALYTTSPLQSGNVSDQIKIFPMNDTYRVLDYKVYKKNSTCYTELAVIGVHGQNGTTSSAQIKDVCLFNDTFLNSSVYSFALTGAGSSPITTTIQYFQTQEMDEFYDLIFSTLGELTKIEFRVGAMIRDPNSDSAAPRNTPDLNQQNYRKILLTEIRDTSWKTDTNFLPTRLMGFVMLPLSAYNVDYKQFIVFEKNTSVLYIITNYNGIQKTSNSSLQTYTLPFKTSRISYANAEFLLFEEPLNLTDMAENTVPTFNNHYLKLPLGKKLEVADFKELKFMTRGRYLSTFTTLQRTLQLYDFEAPDLDGDPNETPITTLYYSKTQDIFAPFLEERSNHQVLQPFEPGSFYRITMESHQAELYRYKNKAENWILLTNRITGQQLPETNLNRTGKVYAVRYLSSHNMLMVKFFEDPNGLLPSTLLLSVQNPYIIFTVVPEPKSPAVKAVDYLREGLPHSRSLQIRLDGQKDATSGFSVMCPSDSNPAEYTSIFNFSFVLVPESLSYFKSIEKEVRADKNDLSKYYDFNGVYQFGEMVLGGMDATFAKNTFIKGGFFLPSFGGPNFTEFSQNQNLKKEIYKVTPSSLDINTFIVYQAVKGRRLHSTLVIDMDNSTEYFEIFANEFKYKRAAIDNREISNVEIIDSGDVMLNVSRNIFVLNFEKLQERPLTGVGSFCRSIILGKVYNIPDVLICLSEGNLFAHYISERYSTKQTRLTLLQLPDTEMLDKLNPISMIYSSHFPGWLVFLSDRATKGSTVIDYSFTIIDLYSFMSVHVIKHVRIDNLTELNQEMTMPNSKILFVDFIENVIIVVTSKLNFFLYLVKDTWAAGRKLEHITFLRQVSLVNYFQTHKYIFSNQSTAMDVTYSLNITRFETIKLLKEPNSDTSYQGERDFENRLAFLLEITGTSDTTSSMLPLGVIFNHDKSAYEAFQVIARGDPCDKLLMGPAFIVQAEIQQKSLAFICIKDAKVKPPVTLNITILQSIEDDITFSKFSGAADIFDYSKPTEVVNHAQTFNVVFMKPYHVLDRRIAATKKITDFDAIFMPQIALNKKVALNFSEPYRIFKVKPSLSPELKEFRIQPHTSQIKDVFSKHSATHIQHRIQDYFDGHIFETKVLCESMVECREKVINGTVELIFTGSLASYPDYGSYSRYRISTIKLPKSYNPDYQMTYVMTKDFFKYSYQNKIYDTPLNNLGENCTDFVQYEGYLIAVCEFNQGTKNFFRIFDMNKDLAYFEIHFLVDSARAFVTKELMLSVKQDYLILYTFNGVFNRYLTVHVFRLVQNLRYSNGKHTKFFFNKLKPDLALVYLLSSPMNDEFVEFKSYVEESGGQQVERIFFWSVRRNDRKSVIIRAEGWQVLQVPEPSNGTLFFNSSKYCDDQRIQLEFKLSSTTGSNYLLDFAKILPLESEHTAFYDVILNLPYAQDYLIRVSRSKLSKTTPSSLNVKEDIMILSISNPFFGIKMRSYLPPVFWNGLYISTSNFIPDLSVMRMYYLGPNEKNRAQKLEAGFLFNYQDTETTDLRNSLEEKGLNTIYTFGVVNYKQYLLSVSLIDSQLKLGDFNFTEQFGKKERDLYLLFVNGTFNILRISNYLQLGISRSYLASNKLTLQSFGPKTKISLDVTLKDNDIGLWEILIFVIHTVVALSVSGGVVWALYLWQKGRPEPTDEEPDDFATNCANIKLNEDEKSGDSPIRNRQNSADNRLMGEPEEDTLGASKETEMPQVRSRLAESSILAEPARQNGKDDDKSLSPVVSDDDEEVDSEEFERQQQQKKAKEEEASTIKMPESKTIDSDPED